MSKDAFKQRENAFETEFFHNVDKRLLENLKTKMSVDANRQRLAESTGIANVELLDEILSQGVSDEGIAALSLAPLILVAWADGKVDAKERLAILKAASEVGIGLDSPNGQLLEHWLNNKPSDQLLVTWAHYVKAVSEKLESDALKIMRDDVIRRARAVAKASGGLLGICAISVSEKRVLKELEMAFSTK